MDFVHVYINFTINIFVALYHALSVMTPLFHISVYEGSSPEDSPLLWCATAEKVWTQHLQFNIRCS